MNFFSKTKILRDKKPLSLKAPKHVAIIMDGNYRFAKANNFSLKIGHKKGTENIEKIVDCALEFGVEFLTLYAFSSENWNRPKDEVDYLMKLLDEYLEKDIKTLSAKGARILISGHLSKLPKSIQEKIKIVQEKTAQNNKITINVAFSYGARQEIVDATKKIALAVSEKSIKIDEINEDFFAKNLYQSEIPDPCLLIRTGGDLRVSNFLLWQIAYTELYFCNVFWPEFKKNHFKKAIIEFNQRIRKYGKR